MDVHDLPQLYKKPRFEELVQTLELLKIVPTSFSRIVHNENEIGDHDECYDESYGNSNGGTSKSKSRSRSKNNDNEKTNGQGSEGPSDIHQVDPQGTPRYLTSIVASSLSWLANDAERETVWDMASARLSERSGRTAMPSMTRRFKINGDLVIELYEPSLTEDNLGLKTWTSSVLLARRLPLLRNHVPPRCGSILELGSGTGLVGIAAAYTFGVDVVLTDLPEIVPNLERNVRSNVHLATDRRVAFEVKALDWSDDMAKPRSESETYEVIIAADPIYSSDHPRILVKTVHRWIRKSQQARFILELPLRRGYESERTDLRNRLEDIGIELIDEGTETGYDDWQGKDGRPSEVECWWSIWKPGLCE